MLCALLSRWGVRTGYLAKGWIGEVKEDSSLKRERGAQRDRRVDPEEETNIRKHATPFLQRLMIGVMETCLREGELLNLQKRAVRLAGLEFIVRDPKNGKDRTLPISPNFKALLNLLWYDPAGIERPGDHYLFGDAIGQRVSFPRKSFEVAVLKAHGIKPEWTKTHAFTPACRAELHRIDLHFHDWRHEAASRLLENGWPLHHIQQMLGHATLAQTAAYLNVTRMGLHDSMRRFGTSSLHPVAPKPKQDQPPACNAESGDGVSTVVD